MTKREQFGGSSYDSSCVLGRYNKIWYGVVALDDAGWGLQNVPGKLEAGGVLNDW